MKIHEMSRLNGFKNPLQQDVSDSFLLITGNSAYIATELGECEVAWERLE